MTSRLHISSLLLRSWRLDGRLARACVQVLQVCGMGACVVFASLNTGWAQERAAKTVIIEKHIEFRQRPITIEELRAIRQAERQRIRAMVRESLLERRAIREIRSETGEVRLEQLRRLTPEEKMALRKQIRNARREVYLRHQEWEQKQRDTQKSADR